MLTCINIFIVVLSEYKEKDMDLNKKPWTLPTVFGIKDRIDTNPDYQRPSVWSKSQKRLLIDTILRGYDIPKMYWRKISKNPDKYEVVDGQQRLRAIWEFMNSDYDLGKDAEPIDGYDIRNATYNGSKPLDDELRLIFDTYTLDVIIMLETDEEEVREMFLRLQNGTSLKAQEKRNAMTGNMRDFIKQMASHKFFENCKFENKRYTYDLIVAQMMKIELEGVPCNIKNADLNKMYNTYEDFDINCGKAKKLKKVLDFLLGCFPVKTPELERYSVISLYIMISYLLENYVISDKKKEIYDWFIQFELYRREQEKIDVDNCDPEIITYHERTSHSTDAEDSLKWRNEYLLRKLFEYIPSIELKDKLRLFTSEQRLAIFRRDNGICQLKIKCNGNKCEWDNWEADHIIPHSKGGKTTVENGQVACSECNKAKSNN
jgi:hypothetical protein